MTQKKIVIHSNNSEIHVSDYHVSVEGKDIESLMVKALRDWDKKYSNTFRGKVHIWIEEILPDITIEGTFDEEKEENDNGENEEL